MILAADRLPGIGPIELLITAAIPIAFFGGLAWLGILVFLRPTPPPYTGPARDRQAAALLAIFLGTAGAHKIYLRLWGEAVLYPLFFWTMVPTALGVLEGVWYLSMSDEAFRRRVVERQPAPGQAPVPAPTSPLRSKAGMPPGWDLCGTCRTLNPIDASFCLRCGRPR